MLTAVHQDENALVLQETDNICERIGTSHWQTECDRECIPYPSGILGRLLSAALRAFIDFMRSGEDASS